MTSRLFGANDNTRHVGFDEFVELATSHGTAWPDIDKAARQHSRRGFANFLWFAKFSRAMREEAAALKRECIKLHHKGDS